MKTCNVCGKAMDDKYTVCPYCGAVLAADANQNYANNQQNTNPYGNQNFDNQQQFGGAYYQQPQQPNNSNIDYTPAPRPQRSAYIAALLAFTLGAFGVHNFYLDKKNRALTQILVSLLAAAITFGLSVIAMQIWAYVEGVKLLKGEINTDGTGAMIKMSF